MHSHFKLGNWLVISLPYSWSFAICRVTAWHQFRICQLQDFVLNRLVSGLLLTYCIQDTYILCGFRSYMYCSLSIAQRSPLNLVFQFYSIPLPRFCAFHSSKSIACFKHSIIIKYNLKHLFYMHPFILFIVYLSPDTDRSAACLQLHICSSNDSWQKYKQTVQDYMNAIIVN